MSIKLILYPTNKIFKKDKIVFFNNLIKHQTNTELLLGVDHKIIKPYGLDSKLLKNNFSKLAITHNKFIKLLSMELNKLHSVNKNHRYWSIVFGAWLRDFIWATYNRYCTLEEAFKENNIDEILSIDDYDQDYVSDEIFDFMSHTNDLLFDAILINKIIEHTKYKDKLNKIIPVKKKSFKNFNFKKDKKIFSLKNELIRIFKFLKIFKKNNDAFIINSGLPLVEEMKLQIYLKQFPQYWEIPKLKYSLTKKDKRYNINLESDSNNEFEIILSKLIPLYIPLSVIENYQDTINFCKNLPWPEKPKFIFTSNSFGSSGVFQIWLAEKVSMGFKYFVGQHGLGYLELNEKNDHIEFKTSDKFFAWGNAGFDKKIQPVFNLKVVGKKIFKKIGKKLIIVTRSAGVRTVHYDRLEYGKIINLKTINLLENLNETIKKETILRLHQNYEKGLYEEMDNFLNKNSLYKIDQKTNYFKLIKNSKLVIFNDISSGFLNNLSINLPSICFLPIGLDFIHEDNKNDYSKLIDKKLMFYDEIKLANFINEIWEDVGSWWNSAEVKKTRQDFCLKYSIPPPKNATKIFSDLLRKEVN